jgi:RNA polymerase sigma factor (sigma-70 family)
MTDSPFVELYAALHAAQTWNATASDSIDPSEFIQHPETGRPMVLYHGTGAATDIEAFHPDKRGQSFPNAPDAGVGYFFAESPKEANDFTARGGSNRRIMPVHLVIKNPKLYANQAEYWQAFRDGGHPDGHSLRAELVRQGHDGIKIAKSDLWGENVPSNAWHIAFEPEQIKSATGNRGTYSKSDPRINYQQAGTPDRYNEHQDTLPDIPAAAPTPAQPNRTPTAMPGLSVREPDQSRGWKLAEGHTFDQAVVDRMQARAKAKGYILDVKPMRFLDGRTRHHLTVYHPKGQRMANPQEFYAADEGAATEPEQPAPIVAYHGSKSKISEFDPAMIGQTDRGMYGHGFSFTTDPKGARIYGPHVHEAELDIKNPVKIGPLWGKDKHADTMWRFLRDHLGEQAANTLPRSEWHKAMEQLGHDGVAVKDQHQIEYLAFHPHQIKIRGIQSDPEPDQYTAAFHDAYLDRYARLKSQAGQLGLFDEQHPRGQPENAGEFKKKGDAAPDPDTTGQNPDTPPLQNLGTSQQVPTNPDPLGSVQRSLDQQGIELSAGRHPEDPEALSLGHLIIRDPKRQRQGHGTSAFRQVVDAARQMGLRRIHLEAARDDEDPENSMAGYYAFARLGADGPLPRHLAREARAAGFNATKVSHLMATPEGRAWWRENGDTMDMTFDLSPDSPSMKVLAGYGKAKPAPAPGTTAPSAGGRPTGETLTGPGDGEVKADPFGTGAGQKFKPSNMPDMVSRDFAYSIQNDVPVPEGGKLIASQIVQRSIRKRHPLFRLSVIENPNGTRYVLTENGRDKRGNLSGAETQFVQVDSDDLESRALEGINRLGSQLWQQHKPGQQPTKGLFSAALTSALLREYYAQRFADRVVERYAEQQSRLFDAAGGSPRKEFDETKHQRAGGQFARKFPRVQSREVQPALPGVEMPAQRRIVTKERPVGQNAAAMHNTKTPETVQPVAARPTREEAIEQAGKFLRSSWEYRREWAKHRPALSPETTTFSRDNIKEALDHLHGHLGEHVTPEETTKILTHAGLGQDSFLADEIAYELEKAHGSQIPVKNLRSRAWNAMTANDRDYRRRDALEQAGDSRALKFAKPDSPVHFIVHPAAHADYQGQWQITRFDDRGPSGHQYHKTKKEAIGAAIGAHPNSYWDEGDSDYRLVEQYTLDRAKGDLYSALWNATLDRYAERENQDYAGEHAAPMRDTGAPAHDLTANGIYPEDVYSHHAVRYYGDGSEHDHHSFRVAHGLRNRPDAKVKIYRAVPLSTEQTIQRHQARMKQILARGSRDPKEYEQLAAEIERLQAQPPQNPATINRGDWVTINPRYAHDHGKSALNGRYHVLSKTVPASHIFTNGDSIHEWGYDPEEQAPAAPKRTRKKAIPAATPPTPPTDPAADLYTALWCAQQGLERYALRSDPRQTSLFGFGETGQGTAVKPRAVGHMGENLAPPTSAILPPHHQARHAALLAKGFRRTPAEQQEFQDLGRRIEELRDRRQPVTREHYTDAPAHWQHDPTPPVDESQYTDADEHHKKLWQFYHDRNASSRTTPSELPNPPVGSWRMDKHFGIYGREIEQLRMVPVHELTLSEGDYTDPKVNDEGRGDDARRYAGWMKEHGLEHLPPIHVVETDQGTHRVVNGHRRTAAAKLAGMTHIPAWVSPRMKTGKKYYGQDLDIGTGLTYEGARHGAEAASKMYEDRQRKLSESIRAERAAKETSTAPEQYAAKQPAQDPDTHLFFHATDPASARALPQEGIRPEAMNRRDAGFFGPGFYASRAPQNFYGRSLVAIHLKPDARVLEVGDLVPKAPAPWHQDFLDSYKRRILKHRPGMDPARLQEILDGVTPGHPTFDHLSYKNEVGSYARSEGFDASTFANGQETVIHRPEAVAHMRHIGGLKAATAYRAKHEAAREAAQVKQATPESYAQQLRDAILDRYNAAATNEFRQWFGNSHAAHPETRQPRVYYHGTNPRSAGKLASGEPWQKRGGLYGWFDTDPERASGYAVSFDHNWQEKPDGAVLPVYLSIQNPKHYRSEYEFPTDEREIEALRQQGHDGVMSPSTAAVFEPHQIKSASGNRGTWSKDQGRIDYREPGQPERYKYTPPAAPRFEPADLEHYLDVRRRSGETRIPRKGETPEDNATYRLSERHEQDIRRRVWPRTNVHLIDVPISMLKIRTGDLAPERQARLKSIQGTDDPVMAHIDRGGKNEIVLNVDDGNNRVAWHREQGHATVPAFLHEHEPGDMEQVRQMIAPHHAKLQRATYRQSIQQAFLDRYRDLTATPEQAPPTTGEPIHHTKTPEFKRFFGDWEAEPHNASKVRHPEGHPRETHEIPGTGSHVKGPTGQPIAVYHGTAKGGFDRFDPEKINDGNLYGPGFYFTESPDIAKEYTAKDAEYKLSRELTRKDMDRAKRFLTSKAAIRDANSDIGIRHSYRQAAMSLNAAYASNDPAKWQDFLENAEAGDHFLRMHKVEKQQTGNPEVKTAYLNIRNPFRIDSQLDAAALDRINAAAGKEIFSSKWYVAQGHSHGENVYQRLAHEGGRAGAAKILQAAGYDGITHLGGSRMGRVPHRVWIAFKPTQIKSVTNRGTWDPEDERMDYEQDQNPVAREPYAQFQDLVALAGLDRYKAQDSPGQQHLFADHDVSDEARDASGQWTSGADAGPAAPAPERTTEPSHDEPAARHDNEELVARVQSGDKTAFDQLLAQNRPFIADRARKAGAREGRDLEDWIQEGSVILWQAAAKFDATQGNKFTTYLGTALDRRFWKLRKKEIGSKDKPRPRHLQGAVDDEGRSINEPLASPDEAPLADQELKQAVRTVVKKIPNPRHQQIVKLAFGLDGPPLTHAQIAEQLGVKPQAVQQQLARILPTLQRQLQDQYAARCLRDAVLERYHAIVRGAPDRYAQTLDTARPDHTETPEFKEWFGESHVRHPETGKPLTVYHGTSAEDFDAFDPEKLGGNTGNYGWYGRGFSFSSKPDIASGYVGHDDIDKLSTGARIMPVHLAIQSPFHIDDEPPRWSGRQRSLLDDLSRLKGLSEDEQGTIDHLRNRGDRMYGDATIEHIFGTSKKGMTPSASASERLRELLHTNGHDGVITNRGQAGMEYTVFHPHQIKSATGNRGTYSKEDPRINYTQAFQDAYRDRYGLADLAGAVKSKITSWTKGNKPTEQSEHEPHAQPARPTERTKTERRAGPAPKTSEPVTAEVVRPATQPPEPSPAARAKQQAATKPLHPRGIGLPGVLSSMKVTSFHVPNLQAAHEALSKLHSEDAIQDEAKRIVDQRVRAHTVNIRNDQQQYRDLFAQQINPTREAVHARLKQQADQALAGAQKEYDQRAAMLRSAHEAARQHRETALRYPEGHPAREKMLAEVQEAAANIRRHAESLQGLHREVKRLHATAPERPEPWQGWGTGESKKPVSDQEREARAQERDARKQAGQQVKWLQYRGVEVPKGDAQDPEYRRQVAAMHEQETGRYLAEQQQMRARREQRLKGTPKATRPVGQPEVPTDPLTAANRAVRDFQDQSQHELLAQSIARRAVNERLKAAGGAPLSDVRQLRKFPGYATWYKRGQEQAHEHLGQLAQQAIETAEQSGADPQEIQRLRDAHAGKMKLRPRETGLEGAQPTVAGLRDQEGNELTPEQVRARKAAQTRATNTKAKAERVEKINTPEVPHPQDLPQHQEELPEEMRSFGWKPPANVTSAQHLLIQSLYGLHGTPQRSFHDLVNETVRRQTNAGPDGPVSEADQRRAADQVAEQVRDAIGKTRTTSAAAAYGMDPREYHQIADEAMHDEVNRAQKHNALFDKLNSAKQQAQLAAGDDHETVLRGFDTLAYPTLQEAEVPGLTEDNAMQKAQEILERGRVPVPGPHGDEWHQAVVDQLGPPPERGQDDEGPPPADDEEEPVPFSARRSKDLRAELYSALWWATTRA